MPNDKEQIAAFRRWLESQYGWYAAYGPGSQGARLAVMGIENHPHYQEWVSLGSPTGLEEPELSPLELWDTYNGIFPVSQFPEEPTFGPEGYHWEQVNWNAALGVPLDEVSWMLVADDESVAGEITGGGLEIWEADGVRVAMAVYYDDEGNIDFLSTQFLFEVPAGELTPWQEVQANNFIATIGLGYAQMHSQNARHAADLGFAGRELDEMARQFDEQMGLSRDQLEWQKQQFMEEIGFSREQLAWEQERYYEGLAWERERFGKELSLAERQHAAYLGSQPGRWIEAYTFGAPEGAVPTPGAAPWQDGALPPAPAWLPTFAPETAAGAPITPGPTKIPSAQAYGRMPWGQREMLGAYSRFAAWPGSPQTVTEIGERVGQMLPRERTRQARWQPAFQV